MLVDLLFFFLSGVGLCIAVALLAALLYWLKL
jgi:hypothetical protein